MKVLCLFKLHAWSYFIKPPNSCEYWDRPYKWCRRCHVAEELPEVAAAYELKKYLEVSI